MNNSRTHKLIQIDWPEFGPSQRPPEPGLGEYKARLQAARAAMDDLNLTHLVVYGDREHFANLAYLTGFDPRFEEAMLIIGRQRDPLLVVGNECEGYLDVSPLFNAGKLRYERYQPFSLLNQPRDASRLVKDILADEGINNTARVGCVGWKYFGYVEHPDHNHAIEIPAYLVDALREQAGRENVINATAVLMHPEHGLRTSCTAVEFAQFEYANYLASEGMKRMLFGLREGMADFELASLAQTNGTPLGCHPTLATGKKWKLGLSSPTGEFIERGMPLSTNICYWGSNSCRAGWIASGPSELPPVSQDYVENFAGPYFEVMGEWFNMLRIDTPGGELSRLVNEKLPYEKFGIFLNPGHLIHMDEWVSSPIYPGSEVKIRSGMAIQVDVIPFSAVYASTRMEDGVFIADETLRQEIQTTFPESYARCQKRRQFMMDVLGIELPEEVLPLANIPAIVPPFFLDPNTVLALEQ